MNNTTKIDPSNDKTIKVFSSGAKLKITSTGVRYIKDGPGSYHIDLSKTKFESMPRATVKLRDDCDKADIRLRNNGDIDLIRPGATPINRLIQDLKARILYSIWPVGPLRHSKPVQGISRIESAFQFETTLKHWLMLSYFHAVASEELKSHCRLPLPGHCLESILERGGLTLDEMELLEEEYETLRGLR